MNNQISAGNLVYVSEDPLTDKPDMRLVPGRLIHIDPFGPGFPEQHGVVERLCLDLEGHLEVHERYCKRTENFNLIRSAGEIMTELTTCYATLQYSDGHHQRKECVAWTSKGLCLLCTDDNTPRYEWRFGPKPIKDGEFQGRRPLTIGGHRRSGDFVVQRLDCDPSVNSCPGYRDVEGDWVPFGPAFKVPDGFQGDALLIKAYENRINGTTQQLG